jgi:colanic acid biosynthesis glycosyl transferase WcaI
MACRNAARVSTLTKGMRARIIQKGFAAEKVILFEPRADDALLEILVREGTVFRRKYELEGNFIVTRSGNFGVTQGLDVILDAAEMCRDDASFVFLLVGNGAARQRIERRATELGLDNVRFMPLLDAQEFRGLLAASVVCLITQRKSVSDIVFPSKVVSYLAAGSAAIASVNACSEMAQADLESNAGTVVEPENVSALRDAICAKRAHDRRDSKRNSRAYASKRWSSTRVLQYFEKSLVAVSAAVPVSLAKQGINQ